MSLTSPSVSGVPQLKPSIPPGFRAAPRPRRRPIIEMTVRELQDLYSLNEKILSAPGASTSNYVHRVTEEQAKVKSRLVELGVEAISSKLKETKIESQQDSKNNVSSKPPLSRIIAAKRKALSQYASTNEAASPGTLSLPEAMRLEQEAHMRDQERLQRITEKRERFGMPTNDEILTRQEREARIWAFMNYKPTESDLEDDESNSDDDPSSWFEDDQDDGRKGQDIVEPDEEDWWYMMHINERNFRSDIFHEPREQM